MTREYINAPSVSNDLLWLHSDIFLTFSARTKCTQTGCRHGGLDVAIFMILFAVVPDLLRLSSDQGKFVKELRSREFWASKLFKEGRGSQALKILSGAQNRTSLVGILGNICRVLGIGV